MTSREQFEEFVDASFPFKKDRFHMFRDEYKSQFTRQLWEAWQAASKASEQQLAAVVAENAGLRVKGRELLNEACKVYEKFNGTISSDSGDFIDGQTLHEFQFLLDVETPETDGCLAEVRDQGRIEGINFAASRIAAAYNNGFIDKPLEDVDDVVRAILSAKGELGNNLPEDGLSGEYAEKSLIEFAAQLRQGEKS